MRPLVLAAVLGLAIPVAAQEPPATARDMLVSVLGFTPEHLERLDRGEVVLGNTLFAEGDEFAIAGAVRVRGDRALFVRTMHPGWRYAHPSGGTQMGVFSDPPQVADLDGLRLDASMISDIRECRPGRCGIQLTTTAMEALQEGIDWSSPSFEEAVRQKAREVMVTAIRDYQANGYGDALPFADARRPVDRVVAFDEMLARARAEREYDPRLHDYLADYPRGTEEGIEDTFYWIRTGGVSGVADPSVNVVHAVTLTDPADPGRVTFVDRLLYSTQYVLVSLGETMISDDPEGEGSFYVVRLQRVQFRVGGGLAHGVVMKKVQGAMRQSLTAELELARTVAQR